MVRLASLVEGLPSLVASLMEGLAALVASLVEGFAALLVVAPVLVVEGLSALLAERLASLLAEGLPLGPVLLHVLLGHCSSAFFLIIIVLVILIVVFVIVNFIINVLIIDIVIEIFIIISEIFVILIRIFFSRCRLGSHDCLLLGLGRLGLLLRGLGLLLRGLRFLLRGSNLGCGLLCHNFFFALLVLEVLVVILSEGEVALLVGLEEAGEMERAVALDNQLNLVEEGDEEVDDSVGAFLGEGGHQVVVAVVLDPEGGSFLGGRSQHGVGEGEHFALGLLDIAGVELEGRARADDLSEKHP